MTRRRSAALMVLGVLLSAAPTTALFIAAVVHMTEADHELMGWSTIAWFTGLVLLAGSAVTGGQLVKTAIEESDRRDRR